MEIGVDQHKRETNRLALTLPQPNSVRTGAIIASALFGSVAFLCACTDQSPASSKAVSQKQSAPLEATKGAILDKAQSDGLKDQVRQPPKPLNYDVQFTALASSQKFYNQAQGFQAVNRYQRVLEKMRQKGAS